MDSGFIIVPRIGFGFKNNFLGRKYDIGSIPTELTALVNIYKQRNFLEIGPGLTLTNFSDHYGKAIIGYLTLRAGYRYQSADGWFMMRLGIIPMYDLYSSDKSYMKPNFTWDIMAGLSIGFAF